MFRAKIYNEDVIIFDLHAEQVFLNIGSEKSIQKGIRTTHINNEPIDNLRNTIEQVTQNKVIIDFSNVYSIQSNLYKSFKKILEIALKKNRNIYIANITKIVIHKIKLQTILSDLSKDQIEQRDFWELITINGDKLTDNYIEFKNEFFERVLINRLIKCTHDYNKKHKSSPVRLSIYIDIKEFIHHRAFFYSCLYRIALISREEIFIEEKSKKVFFCQTLNGAFIASILSELLDTDIAFLDHIGPINKLYGPSFSKRIRPNVKYIVVSDVVCLGTELQIAKNIIEYRGGHYSGNVNIARIRTLEENIYENEFSLVRIMKKNNPINYKIEIDL